MPYRDYMPSIAPPWMNGPWGEKFWQSVGSQFDLVRDTATQATRARFPDDAPADALSRLGDDRQLPQGMDLDGNITETDDDYRARLKDPWTQWGGDNVPLTGIGGGAGSHAGLLNAIALLGFDMNLTTIVTQNGVYSQSDGLGGATRGDLMICVNRVDLTGAVNPRPGWTFDGRDNFYPVFGLIFYGDVAQLTEGSELAGRLNAAVIRWKQGVALYAGAWVIVTGLTLGWPIGRTLGTDPVLGGNVVRYIPPAGGNQLNYTPAP